MEARGAAREQRGLEFAWLELTHACNLRCAQCYTQSTPRTPHRSLPTERWLSLLTEIAEAGARSVQLTGGEPTAHPEWRRLVEHAVSLGLRVELFTNGTTLSAGDLDHLAGLDVALAISLHGPDAATHEAVTGIPGSFEAVTRTIEGACARGMRVRVACVLLAENATGAAEVEALARRLRVLTPVSVDAVRPTGRGRRASGPVEACTGCDGDRRAAMHPPAPGGPHSTCWDGKIAIDPSGVVTPCIFSRQARVGSVASAPLREVLAGASLGALWALSVDDVEACAPCDRKDTCFDCRALPLTALGDVRAKNPRCTYEPPRPVAPPRVLEGPLALGPGVEEIPCGEEAVLLHLETGRVHALNATATRFVRALRAGDDLSGVAARVASAGGVDAATVRADLEALRARLVGLGLLVLAPPAGGPPPARAAAPARPPSSTPRGVGEVGSGEDLPWQTFVRHLGGVVRVRGSEAARAILEPWLGAASRREAGAATVLATLEVVTRAPSASAPPRHYLLAGGRPAGDVSSPAGLRGLFEEVWCRIPAASGAPRLHAAALTGPLGAVLLPGPSGTGKSLAAAAAVAAGAGYLGDEVATLDASGWVDGLPKPVTVKGSGAGLLSDDLIRRASPVDPLDPQATRWLPFEPAAPAPLRAVVLLDASATGLERLGPAEGLAALVQACFDLDTMTQDELKTMAARVEAAQVLALGTGDLPAAAAQLAGLAGAAPEAAQAAAQP